MENAAQEDIIHSLLSPDEIKIFREQGFVGPFTAFTPNEMYDALNIITERVLQTPSIYCPFGMRVRHLDSQTVYKLCSSPAIANRIASIFGPDLVLWNSNIFYKPAATAEHAEEYPWHQDYYNWNIEPLLNISAWLAITPATIENGCVEVIPGSHRTMFPQILNKERQVSQRFIGVASDASYIDESKKVSMELKPGQFFLFNERLLHHSNPNKTECPRVGLAIRVTTPIVKVNEYFPCILLKGQDNMGFNHYTSPPNDEPDILFVGSLPQEHEFNFDRPIPGMGWHLCEIDDSQNFAWTGLEAESTINFRPITDTNCDYLIRLEIPHILTKESLDSTMVSVNGRLVSYEQSYTDGIFVLESVASAGLLQLFQDLIRISICVKKLLRPCDIHSENSDVRTLGVAVRHISITPIKKNHSFTLDN